MTYEITLHGQPIARIDPVTSGDAPDFTLTDLSGRDVTLSALRGTVLISTFPDINTKTCSLQTKRFNVEASERDDIDFLSISTNTPDEQRTWCAAEGVDMTVLSDTGDFGKAYGLLLDEGPLAGDLARAVLVVRNGEIVYSEIVQEISDEPNYRTALEATR
ncbi:thiol peroxidase (atypical 2-Cys peroxiredoxin) [Coriobacterium glomerans PW2]|uniref:Thiol peroxidase (Atypical 2-Cys peroxiredoxin) n=1 Tax=Coriobacterium glomerans (strain ATCC 49209 / DSM 20642 / JCM 10262 / PW2) TaxID=700015 RepID=F2N869_CORGP|nr:peroxiredoxin [Coriobacterium glomerans]AEB07252.1 thiol peroxidase (atypical 2-Cys peroxiredoxin) [Coriobacterium glomerans PW2]